PRARTCRHQEAWHRPRAEPPRRCHRQTPGEAGDRGSVARSRGYRGTRPTVSKRKICVVVTARPSYSRIRTALKAIKEHPDLELQLVVAASALLDRYGSAVHSIEHDGFEIAERVYMVLEGENLVTSAKSTGIGLSELATVFDNHEPDAVVTIAD